MMKTNYNFSSLGRCCSWILPMLLMFFVSTVSAGNSGGEPKSGAVSSVKKSSTVAVVANSVPSNATCPSFNNGSITTTVTSTGAAQPYVLTALLYAGTPPTPPAIGTAIGTSPPLTLPAATVFTGLVAGTYTVRVLVIDPTTGGVLEFFDQVVVVGTTPDATAPTFAGAANITVAAGANCQFTPAVTGGIGTRTVTTNVGITVSEDCSNISSVTFSPAGPFLNGTTTAVTVTATSPGGTSNTVVNVTVRDLTPPTFTTCPANATFAIAACATTAVITFAPPVITDNCTPPNLIGSIELGPATGSALPAGVYNVSYTATDAAGNQSTCTFSITVTPPVNPPLVCAATTATSTTVPIGACANTTTLMYTLNPPTGGCPPIVMVSAIGPASGTVVGPGTYTVGGTYRGAAGQTIVCTTDIVVAAPTRPAIVCGALMNIPQPITVCNTTTTLNYSIAAPTGGCAPLTLVASSGSASGTVVTAGSYTIVQTYRDAVGTSMTCTYQIVVAPAPADITKPVITCPANVVVTEGACNAAATATYAAATATDNCTPSANIIISQTGPASGSALKAGVYPVVFTATDLAGNSATCQFTITVNANNDVTAPVLAGCPASFTVTTAICGGTAAVNYASPTATDNCPGPVAITQTGPVSGAVLPAGVYQVIFTATDVANNTSTCGFSVTVVGPISATLVCKSAVNVSLSNANGCTTPLLASSVLEDATCQPGTPFVEVKHFGIWGSATLTRVDIGKTWDYRVTVGGNTCWGTVLIEDKERPTITCPANITLACNQDPFDTKITGDISGAINQNSTATNDGSFADCSAVNEFFSDNILLNGDCVPASYSAAVLALGAVPANTIKVIVRTWTVKDIWGYSSLPCNQVIYVVRPAFVVTVANFNGTCAQADFSPAGLNSWPVVNGSFIKPGDSPLCGLTVTPPTDVILQLCGSGIKIIRTWTVIDMCKQAALMVSTLTQIINLPDVTPPTASVTYQNYGITTSTWCDTWSGTRNTADRLQSVRLLNPVTATFSATPITITPLADANVCEAAQIAFSVKASDPVCGNGMVTFSSTDSRILFNGSRTVTVAGGTQVIVTGMIMKITGTTFTITASDVCGNKTNQVFNVNITDNLAPNVVCIERHRASLTTDGTVRVYATTFNNGSTDNCGIKYIQVRRMTVAQAGACGQPQITNPDPCFNQYVDFTCGDVGSADIMVMLRITDGNDNFSDCMVVVNIDDKTKPVCVNSPDINKLCTDVDLSSYKTLFSRPAAYDNCGIKTTTFSDNRELTLNCGKGDVTRTWVFTDCAGNTAACNQLLTVRAVYGFTVPKLADEFKACALGTADINTILENDRRTILASASLTTFAGVKTCSAPIVETEYWKYSSTQYCQIYRIRYTIVDKCAPFLSYLPGRRGLCNVLHDAAVPGFRYGNPNAACTLVESVDVTGATNSADQQHVVIYERDIFINDVTPPTSTVPANADICSYAGTPAAAPAPCSFSYTGTLTGADNCGGAGTAASDPATLTFMWRAVNAANVQVAVGTTSTVTLTNVPFGTYTICYRVTDLCGNMSQEFCYTVTGRDCKKPTIVCHDVSAELMRMAVGSPSAGMVTVWATDLLASPLFDNCTARTFLDSKLVAVRASANPTNTYPTGAASVNFTCADLTGTNPVPVQLWTIDEAGNADFCLAYVTVQDNLNNACSAGATQSTIAGTVASENGAVVRDVAVAATNAGITAGTATTSAAGTYSIATNARGANVQVRATKTISDDKYAGVTTYDIALISKHILDIAPLSTPYKMIAADVDRSGDINANDMLQLRRFILHISSDLLAGNFRFVDKSYSFRNPANPFAEDFAEVANLTSVPVSAQANFVAVKIGDVNQDYTAQLTNGLVVRGARTLVLNANDMDVVAGNEYTVNVASDNFNAAALQGTFTLNNATVKSVKAGNLNNMSDVNFGIFADKVTAAWNGTATATADVFTINFVANKSGKLSEILSIGSALTPAVAYDAQGNDMNVTLKFNTGKVSGGEFALYANTPNPVAQSTKIGFNMPKEGAAKMTFYTVDGKVLRVVNGDYKAGYNEINVAKSDLGTTGVVYYRLETADQAATKKMIIIE